MSAVRAIRGAITVDANTAEDILDAARQLLEEIYDRNSLSVDEIISIIFSVTKDLDAVFPAVAARQLGWSETALMCTNEIDVPGSLERCIRVLLHINTTKKAKEIIHIYLKGAVVLRPDLVKETDLVKSEQEA